MFTTTVSNPYDKKEAITIICVTTNGEIRKDGRAVMGAGCAKFVRDNFKDIDRKLAGYLRQYGNRVFNLGKHTYKGKEVIILTFPTKNLWNDESSLELIGTSSKQLVELSNKFNFKQVYIPIPGCSNGKLVWSDVKNVLNALDERFVVYSLRAQDFKK